MAPVTVSRTIPGPADQVWGVLRDFGGTATYNPAVVRSAHTSPNNQGVGATRRCDINEDGSKHVIEQIIDWDEDARRYRVEMIDGTSRPPVEQFLVDIGVDAAAGDTCSVTMTARLEATSLMQRFVSFMGSRMMTKVLNQVLDGLEHHVATGEVVTDLTQLKVARAS